MSNSDPLRHFIANSIVSTSTRASGKPKVEDLAEAISEVTIRTQIAGASFLTVTLIDPYWELQTSGFIDVSTDGLVDQIEVEFPQGSGSFWRLCMVEGTRDTTGSSLTLTFEDRIVSELRNRFGPRTIAKGSRTRAQFIRQLASEVKSIKTVIPSINVVQPIAAGTAPAEIGTPTVVRTRSGKTVLSVKTNKARGIGAGAQILLPPPAGSNSPLSAEQIDILNTVLSVGHALSVSELVMRSAICTVVGESSISYEVTGSYQGPFQANPANGLGRYDTAGQARAFFVGDSARGFQGGGAIALARTISDPGRIAYIVQGDLANFSGPTEAAAHYSQYDGFARQVIAAGGGISASGVGGANTATTVTTSDVAHLARGTMNDPYESSWECITRLATEVNWFAFSNADTLYYMDGPDMAGQKPSAYIDVLSNRCTHGHAGAITEGVISTLRYTFDNTAFTYQAGKRLRGHVARRSRISKPQTPAQVMLSLVCDVDDYRAGDVFVFTNAGPMNRRWIVTDATRNVIGDVFTQFTLEPPRQPLPEPADTSPMVVNAASVVAGLPTVPGATAKINPDGTASAPASAPDAVQKVIAAGNQIIRYPYSWGGGHGAFAPGGQGEHGGPGFDCSGAVSYALHGGGLLDTTLDSTGLETWGEPGNGVWITSYGSTDHAWLEVAGIYLDTSSSGSPGVPAGTGPRWRTAPDGNSGPGFQFIPRHPRGL